MVIFIIRVVIMGFAINLHLLKLVVDLLQVIKNFIKILQNLIIITLTVEIILWFFKKLKILDKIILLFFIFF